MFIKKKLQCIFCNNNNYKICYSINTVKTFNKHCKICQKHTMHKVNI